MSKPFAIREVLRKNPQVDTKRAEAFVAFRDALNRSGIDVAPRYRITPALGGADKANSQKQGLKVHSKNVGRL